MKWMVASDLHGSAYYCRQMLEAFDREAADRLLLLGDLLYHGPRNDLPKEYAPKEVVAMLNSRKQSLFCVRGNCESEVDQMVLEFPILADYALLSLGKRVVFVTHGHHFHQNHLPPMQPGDLLLHGHTHVPAWTVCGAQGEFSILNPGSVSMPKENSPHSYLILTEQLAQWKTLDGTIYHEWILDPIG